MAATDEDARHAPAEGDAGSARSGAGAVRKDSTQLLPEGSKRQRGVLHAANVVSWMRLVTVVPATALLVMSVSFSLVTVASLFWTLAELFGGHVDLINLSVEFVEYTDFFLLSTVLYMTSLGLFSLFVTDRTPLPPWLAFHDFDDIKERIARVVVVMLVVFFFGEVLRGKAGESLLVLGVSISLVVVSMSIFLRCTVPAKH